MIKFSIKQEQMAAAFNYLNVLRDAHEGNPLLLKRAVKSTISMSAPLKNCKNNKGANSYYRDSSSSFPSAPSRYLIEPVKLFL
jgi:hypothetical protein